VHSGLDLAFAGLELSFRAGISARNQKRRLRNGYRGGEVSLENLVSAARSSNVGARMRLVVRQLYLVISFRSEPRGLLP
jgi:hypothetical protein